jgi:hypothetical protein
MWLGISALALALLLSFIVGGFWVLGWIPKAELPMMRSRLGDNRFPAG